MRADAGRLIGVVLLSIVVTGCSKGLSTLDGALPVALRISTTASSVDVDAPGWLADISQIYVCSAPPPPLPDSAADRRGWTPGSECHDFGRHPSRDGLAISLPISDLAGPERPAFEAAPNWYLLVLDLDGDLVASAVRSSFHAPPLASPS